MSQRPSARCAVVWGGRWDLYASLTWLTKSLQLVNIFDAREVACLGAALAGRRVEKVKVFHSDQPFAFHAAVNTLKLTQSCGAMTPAHACALFACLQPVAQLTSLRLKLVC